MMKKRYNWKARSVSEVQIDNSETKKLSVCIEHRKDDYDNCNSLVLPSQKRKIINKTKNTPTTRLLSKKRRKQLEKVVERKKKKLQRVTLLEELSKVQTTQDELNQYVSLSTLQTKGLKRHFRELNSSVVDNIKEKNGLTESIEEPSINAIKGAKKRKLSTFNSIKKDSTSDPNIIGFNDSSESDSESNDEEHVKEICLEDKCEENEINNQSNIEDICEGQEDSAHLKNNVNAKKNKLEKVDISLSVNNVDAQDNQDFGKRTLRNTNEFSPAVFVKVDRKPEIQSARLKLPIVAEEQIIMETINANSVIIITGETGSGKTTQVPQFLYEAGYAQNKMIGITEPRRVAAMSMSKRVAEEMNLPETKVSYLIRFEGNVTPETKIKFMTDGVLLKEVQNDFLLSNYSAIILDEAHERNVYTDILIGLLSRIVLLRNKRKDPLKLIIMSATLHVEEFIENKKLFKIKPPIINIESRQFPVTIHFNKRTNADYVTDALRKAIKIHTRLPEGGILIFLTGQQEVNSVVRKLRKAFPYKKQKFNSINNSIKSSKQRQNKAKLTIKENEESSSEENSESDLNSRKTYSKHKQKKQQFNFPSINLDNYSVIPSDDTHQDLAEIGDVVDDNEGDIDDENEDEDIFPLNELSNAQPLWVLPLYSLLPSHKQARVFECPPENCRLCVVSTNIAETSLTIQNIKYVIDCGHCKTRMYDKVTGVSTYRICYTSKAAANQRAGRSGRSYPGHCYRLYSSAVFNDQFEPFSISEIQRKPIDDLILQMKVMNIDKVINFPFPTSPDSVQLKTAEKQLITLGALYQPPLHEKDTFSTKVTPLGRSIAAFPVAPRYGKMLALSHQYNLLKYTICMVAALSVQEVLIENLCTERLSKSKFLQIRRSWAGVGNSLLLGDPMILIKAVGAAEHAGAKGNLTLFCEENGLRQKAIVEIKKLRQQLTNEINLNIPNINLIIDPKMPPPTDTEARLLRQIVLAGMVNQVARKISPDEITNENKNELKHAYKTVEMEDTVFMHSTCVLWKTYPEWVVYQEVYETNKMYMRGITEIEPDWLPKFAPTLCQLSDPLTDPPPKYDSESGKVICHITGTFGKVGWKLPTMELEHPVNLEGVKWFAYFFLNGAVCTKLKKFVPSLLSTPSSVNKSWAKLLPRTEALIKTLLSEEITSKCKLLEIWEEDQTFLLSAYQKWLPASLHAEVSLLWPPM